ncbi:MAG: pyruvate oxidase [Lactobacillaceae bacterium]|jgi:pyruvate oxidase|nr:pyruvate oxidase [Lactobacillaceae bacterium]
MAETINAGVAMVKVLEAWGVKHIYGIPGGSINSTMNALAEEKDQIKYIQVRHEEAGAMAAAADAKLTGKIGVAFGSAGPGGTHLLNGLYDAREDHVPVLALVGQFGTGGMNMDTFQEMNENPIYADVSVYNVTVMTAESLPHVIDEAIRRAYAGKGVAVVQIPTDLPTHEIPAESWYASANSYNEPIYPVIEDEKINEAVEILTNAERPLIYFGIGTRKASVELVELSKKLKIPLMNTAIAKGIVPDDYEALLGSANRVSQKPGNEALHQADAVLFIGNNYPFAEVTNAFKNTKKFIQVDIDSLKLGKRHKTDVAILGDSKTALRQMMDASTEKAETPWWRANIANLKNWQAYMTMLEDKTEGDLQLYQVFKQINRIAEEDAVFSVDVGDVTQTSVRHLHLNGKQPWFTSALFATMGVGIPGAIAAKLQYPDRQVFSLVGDGAMAMNGQDLVTQKTYGLNAINVIFTNHQFGFITDEQEDAGMRERIGVDFEDIDFSKYAEAMGVKGIRVTKVAELPAAFDTALAESKSGRPVLIDAVISNERPYPVEIQDLTSDEFKKRYEADNLQPLTDYMMAEGIEIKDGEVALGGF